MLKFVMFALMMLVSSVASAQGPLGWQLHTASANYGNIPLMSHTDGTPDPWGERRVLAIDFGSPLVGYKIKVDLSECASTYACVPAAVQTTIGNCTWDCSTNILECVTDSAGYTDYFTLIGGSTGMDQGNGTTACAKLYISQTTTSSNFYGPWRVRSAVFDLDSQGGVGVSDLGIFADDRFSDDGDPYRQRSDYDNNGVITAGDLSLFGVIRFGDYAEDSGDFTCSAPQSVVPASNSTWGRIKRVYLP